MSPFFEETLVFGAFDHVLGDARFYGSRGVQVLQLAVDAFELHERSIAYSVEYVAREAGCCHLHAPLVQSVSAGCSPLSEISTPENSTGVTYALVSPPSTRKLEDVM